MTAGSPEELLTLLEDALLLQDQAAVVALFAAEAVLVGRTGCRHNPLHATEELLDYVAADSAVTVARDVAVAVGHSTVNISCRGPDRRWRLAAVLLRPPCSGRPSAGLADSRA